MEMSALLIGWKAMSFESQISVTTLKRWHYGRKRIPFVKTSNQQQGKIMIGRMAFYRWLGEITHDPMMNR